MLGCHRAWWKIWASGVSRHVVVIGDGIVGVAAARELALAGAEVTLIGRGPESGGASWRSFGWLGAAQEVPDEYHRLRLTALARYRALLEDPALHAAIRFSGSLAWEADGAPVQALQGTADREPVQATFQRLRRLGHSVTTVDRDRAALLDPALRPEALPEDGILWARDEGWIDLPSVMGLLLAESLAAGARHVSEPTGVVLTCDDVGRPEVRTRDGDEVAADAVLVAVGAGTPRLLANVGFRVPAQESSGSLLLTAPHAVQARMVARTSVGNIRPRPGGGFVIHSTDFDRAAHGAGDARLALDLLRRVGLLYRGAGPLQLDRVVSGSRPIPGDGWPVVGAVPGRPGLYVAFTHSGATLGLLLGELIAAEILDPDHRSPQLTSYRPERFTT